MRFFQLLAYHECIEGREHGLRNECGIMFDDRHVFCPAKEHGRAGSVRIQSKACLGDRWEGMLSTTTHRRRK